MTTTRSMNAMAGFDWLKRGINLGRNNPKAIFGGAALLLLAMVVLAIAVGLLQVLLQSMLTPGIGGSMVIMALTALPLLLAMAVLMTGYLRLVHAVESGRPARATDVFRAFSETGVAWRMFGFMVVLTVIQYALMIGVLMVVAAEAISWYMQMMQAAASGTPPAITGLPDGIGLAYAVMVVIGLAFYAVQSIGLGQIALHGRRVFPALADGFAGAVKNVLPLLMLLVAFVLLFVVAMVVVFLLAMLFAMLSKVAFWLVVVLAVPLYLAALLAIVVISFGVMYALWRDVCGDGGDDVAEAPADALTA